MKLRNRQRTAHRTESARGGALVRKLRNRGGETITEVLVAVLIAAVALVLLAGMITTTANLIDSSRTKVHGYAEKDLALAEKSGTDAKEGSVVVKCGGSGVKLTDSSSSSSIAVKYYENPDAAGYDVISYKVK